jgi:hypothetical protein
MTGGLVVLAGVLGCAAEVLRRRRTRALADVWAGLTDQLS